METKGCECSGHTSQNKAFLSSHLRLPSPAHHHKALGSPAFPALMLKEAVTQQGPEEQKWPNLCVRE